MSRWNGNMRCARLLTISRLLPTSTPAVRSVSISWIRAAGSITRPLPITAVDSRPQNAARNQLQDVLRTADEDSVAGVVPALVSSDDVEAIGEKIDDLSFTFVTPLRTQNNNVAHCYSEPLLAGNSYSTNAADRGWGFDRFEDLVLRWSYH